MDKTILEIVGIASCGHTLSFSSSSHNFSIAAIAVVLGDIRMARNFLLLRKFELGRIHQVV